MNKFFFSAFIVFAIFKLVTIPALAQPDSIGASAVLKKNVVTEDKRVEILELFFKKYNSPLLEYAQEFVAAADNYGIDWKLVPAITGVESTFGKQIPAGSFNAYGWNNGDWKFKSWQDSIWYVTSQLKTKYVDRGVVSIYQIGRVYAPPSPFWPARVNHFMAEIESSSNFKLDL